MVCDIHYAPCTRNYNWNFILSTREFLSEILCSGKSQGFSCIPKVPKKPRLIKNFQFLTAIEDKSPRGLSRGGTSFF